MSVQKQSTGSPITESSPQPESHAPTGASYSRYSSDHQDDGSIAQQQHDCREGAVRRGMSVDPGQEYADEAVSGTKLKREGLDLAIAAGKRGEYQVLFFQSLSRLARESLIGMSVLKDLVYNYSIRVISTSEGFDTIHEGWETQAMHLLSYHEHFIKQLQKNVRRGHEYALREGFALPDWPFGYAVEDVPGTERGKGRNRRCRRRYVVNAADAEWVRRIFGWYTVDRWSTTRIARELTRQNAPKDHRSRTKGWKPDYVRRLLSNSRYIGRWTWGVRSNKRNPLNGKVTAEVRPESEWGKFTRDLPDLRIIDDATWNLAQARLAEGRLKAATRHRPDGKFKGTNFRNAIDHPRHLLAGLLKCASCGRFLNVTSASRMTCSSVIKGLCECRTQLHRGLAECLITHHVLKAVWESPAWTAAVLCELKVLWRELMRRHPDRRKAVRGELAETERMIESILCNMEKSPDVGPMVVARLQQRQRRRDELTQELQELDAVERGAIPEPTEGWLRSEADALRERLTASGPSANPILRELVGGAIVMSEVKPESGRPFWRGVLTIRPGTVVSAIASRFPTKLPDIGAAGAEVEPYSVTIDFINRRGAEYIDRVKELRDRRYTFAQIAQELGIGLKRVHNALQAWYQREGLARPADDRLRKPADEPPAVAALAERVMPHYRQGLTIEAIASIVGYNRCTITKAVTYWYTANGAERVDGRARYRQLLRERQQTEGTEGVV